MNSADRVKEGLKPVPFAEKRAEKGANGPVGTRDNRLAQLREPAGEPEHGRDLFPQAPLYWALKTRPRPSPYRKTQMCRAYGARDRFLFMPAKTGIRPLLSPPPKLPLSCTHLVRLEGRSREAS